MANKYLAAILSFIIPGLGQAYCGDLKKGIKYFIVALIFGVVVSIIFVDWVYYIVNFLISVYAAVDAYLMVE